MRSAIQSSLRAGISRAAVRVGPFLALFDANDDNPFRNYAVPDNGALPTAAQVTDLITAFTERDRRPRLEYVTPAPDVDRPLLAAGFTVDLRLPLMVATEPPEPVSTDGLVVCQASTDTDLRAVALVQNRAYQDSDQTSDADIARLRATLDAGGGVVLARWADAPVGAGLHAPSGHGLAEIAAVGVVPEFRRRGVASAVARELTRMVLARGATPFLQTETDNESRLYGKLGYQTVGELVVMIG